MRVRIADLPFKVQAAASQRFSMLVLACAGLALLFFTTVKPTNGQSDFLEVHLEWPNEGETLYAGPSSLLYKVPIKGWINTIAFSEEDIVVTLDIYKGSTPVGSLQTIPDSDGHFEFYATVNPEGSTEEFSIAFNDCGELCHSPGNINFQPGKLQLRVTATDPDGNQAFVERQITIDIAELATVPVTVVLADLPEQPVGNVNVAASTWVYMWRARFGHGITDERGEAAVQVEALSQSATEYLFSVPPTVINGVLYEGVAPVPVQLPPGASFASPITLTVNAYTGAISGQILGMPVGAKEDISVWAIRLPDGESYQADLSIEGGYAFPSLPIDRYLIAIENGKAFENGFSIAPQSTDLLNTLEAVVDMPLEKTAGNQLSGRVLNEAHKILPFAWVTLEEGGKTSRVLLDSGTFAFIGLPPKSFQVSVSAPGYYSQVQQVDLSSGSRSDIDLILTEQPETRMVPWGSGAVVCPPETQVILEGGSLVLEKGWIWGENDTGAPLTIQTPVADINLTKGRFALAYLPGEQAWLYQFSGRAQVQDHQGLETIVLQSNQMVNLLNDEGLRAVSYNPVVVDALDPTSNLPILPTWEPTLRTRLHDRLAHFGVNTAQVITFVTYFIVLLTLFILPWTALYWGWKRNTAKREQ